MDNKLITVTSPLLPNIDDFNEMLKQIWVSKWITNNGSFHKQLEKELATYLKVPYISLFTNGTLPLITALQALRITGEVITTPYSFVATTHALWWNYRDKPFSQETFDNVTSGAFFQKTEYKSKAAAFPSPGTFSDVIQKM